MRSVLVHAALLLVALAGALTTWTAEDAPPPRDAALLVWQRPADQLASLSYRSGPRRVDIERRSEGSYRYLWARETFPAPLPSPDSTGAPGGPTLTTDEYPVGDQGEALASSFAELYAVRDLGEADEQKLATYGLTGSDPSLTIAFTDGTERTLLFGGAVAGGGPRYALDSGSGRIYVLPAELVIPFEGGVGTLRLERYQPFQPDEVQSVDVRAGGAQKTLQRRTIGSPPRPIWLDPETERQDVAFGNFLQQLDGLWIERYDPSVTAMALQLLVRADYLDWRGQSIGYVELYRGSGPGGAPRYFMRAPRTVVLGQVYASQGERLEQEIRSLLQASPAPPQG